MTAKMSAKTVKPISLRQIKSAVASVAEILDNPVIAKQMATQRKISSNYMFNIAYRTDGIKAHVIGDSMIISINHGDGRSGPRSPKFEEASIICTKITKESFADNTNFIFTDGGTVTGSGKPTTLSTDHGEKLAQGLKTLAYIVKNERAQTGFMELPTHAPVTFFP